MIHATLALQIFIFFEASVIWQCLKKQTNNFNITNPPKKRKEGKVIKFLKFISQKIKHFSDFIKNNF